MITIRFSGRTPSPREISIGEETDAGADGLRFRLPELAPWQIATLQMILPDGTPEAVTIEDGEIALPASMTAQAGRTRAWVEVLGDNSTAWHSELFYLDVGELPPISEEVEQTYPTAFQQVLAATAADKAAAAASAALAEAAAAYAAASSGQASFAISTAGHLVVTWTDTDGESHSTDIGEVSAYAVAVKNGYTGTEAQWETYIATASTNAAAAAASKLDAEAYATGKRDGTDVENTDEAYHNNAKYYNDQAQSAKTAAQEAAGTAAAAYGTDLLAEDYDTDTGATAGKYYIHSGDLYLCTSNATGAWDSTKFQKVDVGGQLSDLKSASDALARFVNYSDIATFTESPSTVEIGNSTASVDLAWTFNSTPSSLTLNGVTKSTSSTGETVTATDDGTTHKVEYTLATSIGSKKVTFNFWPKVYFGAAEIPDAVNSAFLLGLPNGELAGSRARTFTVNATSGKYIWYAVPVRYGVCSFRVGGFEGGFEAPQTVNVTNASGNTENYYVYRSTNPSLGSTTVVVS